MQIGSHVAWLAGFGALLVPARLEAYIDPGTGSYFLQLMAAGVLGGAFAIKTFWKNIKEFLQNRLPQKK